MSIIDYNHLCTIVNDWQYCSMLGRSQELTGSGQYENESIICIESVFLNESMLKVFHPFQQLNI